jgi:hypothetical protein
MKLEAAITGNLHKFMVDQKLGAETAVTKGVTEIATSIKEDLRKQVINAGLGNKLAKSWQAKIYPTRQVSISAAGVVSSKAPKIISAFNDGALIKSSKGIFLAIPTEHAPKRGIGNKRINPSNFPEHRFGKLRFVYINSSISLLIANSKRKGKTPKVMFILVPQAQIKKRFDYMTVVNKWIPELPSAVLNNWPDD